LKEKFGVLLALVLLLLVPPGIQNNDVQDIILEEPIEVEKIESVKSAITAVPFIENLGQKSDQVKFYAKTFTGTVFITENDFVYSIPFENDHYSSKFFAIKETFLGEPLDPKGFEKSDTVMSYFFGDKENWHSNIPTYKSLSLGEVWPSVFVSSKAYENNIEKIFEIQPGGSVQDIKISFDGVQNVSITPDGELQLKIEVGSLLMSNPIAFQYIDGLRNEVNVSYAIDGNTYGFDVGQYDSQYPLVIDPILAATFFGGGSSSTGDNYNDVTLDSSGNVYAAGDTNDSAFPATVGNAFVGSRDVIVSKFNSDLTTHIASVILGSDANDFAEGIAIDGSGNVFITGETNPPSSFDFPTAGSPFQSSNNGGGRSICLETI